VIEDLAVAHAVTAARLRQQIGALLMDSSPPASTSCAEPARIWSAASITAFSPEPHILLTVVHGTLTGTPAPTAAWRAGAWPSPAGSTHP